MPRSIPWSYRIWLRRLRCTWHFWVELHLIPTLGVQVKSHRASTFVLPTQLFYTVTVTDANGCTSEANVTVHATNVIVQTGGGNGVKKSESFVTTPTVQRILRTPLPYRCHPWVRTSLTADYLGDCNAIDPCTGMPKAALSSSKPHTAHQHDHEELSIHPNPNHGQLVNISFTLPEGERASLIAYDLSGKEVAVINSSIAGTGISSNLTFNAEMLENWRVFVTT